MSPNSSFTQRRFSLAGETGLIAHEALCYGSSRHQFEMFLGMCFKAWGIKGPCLGIDQ
jgi:hypothetical protein